MTLKKYLYIIEMENYCVRCQKKLRKLYNFKYGFFKAININYHKKCFNKLVNENLTYDFLLEIM